MFDFIYSIHELAEHIFEYMDLKSKLNFMSCNKFLRYTYSYLIRINDTRTLTNDDVEIRFFDNCISCYLNPELKRYPRHLKQVILPDIFDESIYSDCIIPSCITHLTFSERFNQPINDLPKSITHLKFGFYFNQSIKGLPESITHLTFGCCFVHPLKDLPKSITHLTFGKFFNQPIKNLPNSITHLTFGEHFNQPINDLPESGRFLIG